jgi:hypothetical protein
MDAIRTADGASAQPDRAEDPEIPLTIELDPVDWRWAAWRPRSLQSRPEPKPFDRADCVARLAKIGTRQYGFDWAWEDAGIADTLTSEEAAFWFTAMSRSGYGIKPKDLAAELAQQSPGAGLSVDAIRSAIRDNGRILQEWLMIPLANLLPFRQLSAWLQDDNVLGSWVAHHYFFAGLRKHVLPYVAQEDIDWLKNELRPKITLQHWPASSAACVNRFHLAACLGMPSELSAVVASWADDHFVTDPTSEAYQVPQYLVFGLGDGRSVAAHMRRLKLRLKTPQQIIAWLACTEYDGLDLVRDAVLAAGKRGAAEELLTSFARVKAPEAAPFMLELSLTSKAPALARKWLEDNPHCSIAGLIPLAGKGSKLAEAATQLLRDMRKRGHQDFLEKCLSKVIAARAVRVRQEMQAEAEANLPALDEATTPDWLREALATDKVAKANLPTWLRPAELPSLVIGKQRLNEEQVMAVLQRLRSGNLRACPPLLAALKAHADRMSLDAFAWDLFERWQGQGNPSKEKWMMGAVGFLGGDALALKLAPLIRLWPGQSQHQRAAFGLECLRAIGSDTALMQLSNIAQKVKFQALKRRAAECMDDIAQERGRSRAELEDHIVPDCDLDEHGSRVFDFGPQQFTFALDKNLKPMVRDSAGKLKSALPKPGAKDDEAKAATALADWKLLKKNLQEVLRAQGPRLERAMIVGRRWPRERFESLLVRHPLMTHLVRRLVWGVYGPKQQLLATFRLTEERDYADAQDKAFDPGPAERIGIVHPAHLDAAAAGAWGELFSEYEIIPPFPQLGRPIYKLEPGEESRTEITRFSHFQIQSMIFIAILNRQGWTNAGYMSGFHQMSFPGTGVTAVIECDSGSAGYDALRIGRCYFLAETEAPAESAAAPKRLTLGEVHPVVLSEVLRNLHALQNAAAK